MLLGVEPLDTRCPRCGEVGSTRYSGLADRMCGVPGTWEIAECTGSRCDLMWVTPRPTDEQIPGLYTSYYTHSAGPTDVPSTVLARMRATLFPTPLAARQLRRRRDEVLPRSLHVTGRDLLEIGCGNGVNLIALRRLGWNVDGHEPDAEAADVASNRLGQHVERGAVEEVDWRGRRYDVILTNHVLEHLSDPHGVLATCVSLLKPGGALVNFTPNAQSLSRAIFRGRWRGFEPPRHLQIFGPQSARTLLEAAGLSVERISTSFASDGYLASRSVLAEGAAGSRSRSVMRVVISVAAQLVAEAVALARRDVGGELLAVGRKAQ